MKKEVLQFLIDSLQNNKSSILITVVSSSGHAPGREGFTMAVTKDSLFGTIGGGTIEKNMVNKARNFIEKNSNTPKLFYREHRISAGKNSSGMICGGTQTIAVHPIRLPDLEKLKKCIRAINGDTLPQKICLSPFCVEVFDAKDTVPFLFTTFCNDDWFYEELIGNKDTAYIFGGGHVCLALSPILASLGFRIVVLDERAYINTLQENKFCDQLFISPFNDLPKMIKEGPYSYAFIMTPSHIYDENVLKGLLGKDLKYIGMMASKTKVTEIFTRLEKEGYSKEKLNAIHSPIGLPIKSRTPEEIAISIAAEVIQVKNSL